jgi:hypothetical protein
VLSYGVSVSPLPQVNEGRESTVVFLVEDIPVWRHPSQEFTVTAVSAAGSMETRCWVDAESSPACYLSQRGVAPPGGPSTPPGESCPAARVELTFEVSSLGDAESSLGDAKSSLGDAKSSLGDAESSLGDSESSLGDAKSSLGDAKNSLGDAESSLGDSESSLGDAKSSLGDVESSLGDAESSLGDAESSLGDAERLLGDVQVLLKRPAASAYQPKLRFQLLDATTGQIHSVDRDTSAAPRDGHQVHEVEFDVQLQQSTRSVQLVVRDMDSMVEVARSQVRLSPTLRETSPQRERGGGESVRLRQVQVV